MKIFAMMIGIPGSGKTWLRQKAFYDADVVCPDEKIGYTKDRPWTPQAVKLAWRESEGKFTSLLKSEVELMVFDATNTTISHRRKYLKRAVGADFQTVAVFCNTPEKHCLERNETRDRNRQVPWYVIQRMRMKLESPTVGEFNLVAKIDAASGVYSFSAAEDCQCMGEILRRFEFLWVDGNFKSLAVAKR